MNPFQKKEIRPSRRQFVRKCCTLGAAASGASLARLGLISANAQTTSTYKALVCVFLFGGNDGTNSVVPVTGQANTDYQRMRGGLAIASNQLLPIGGTYGLHPRLTAIQRLYSQQRAAVVFNVGTLVRPVTREQIRTNTASLPRNLFSHSDQTLQWQTSNPQGSSGTGWGGRAIDTMINANPPTFPPGVSLSGNAAFLSGISARAINLSPGGNFGLDTFGSSEGTDARLAAMRQMLTFDSGVQLIGAANAIFGSALKGAEEINRTLSAAPALRTQFPDTGIGRQMEQIARVLQVRTALGMTRQIFFCGQGGYDNHEGQLFTHDSLLGELSAALDAFWNAQVELGVTNNVTVFTESEFGRTGNPSATAGTDHAWGNHHFVFGGAVKGGQTYGTFPQLVLQGPDDSGDRGAWIPSTALDQYGATLASWFGVPDAQLGSVFPNLANFATAANPTAKLGFMNP